jgi:hypothetical protein
VVCGDCEYSNQCQATSADPTFKEDTCTYKVIPIMPPPTDLSGGTGLVKIDGECKGNEVCDSGYCYLIVGSGNPGTCACNPATKVGCAEDYECAGSKQLIEAQGMAFIVEPRPECRLPYGAACSPDDPKACLTGVCDSQTESCACNSMTNYPCNTENGEKCYLLDGSSVCTYDSLGDQGLFKVGDPCTAGEECDTGYCYQTRGAQFCSCNPETAAGCTGEEVCASSKDLIFAQGVADVPPSCFLHVGAKCEPTERTCLSTNCDKTTLQCACNSFSNWPCDIERGEECVLDENKGYVCQLKVPEILCPKTTGICTDEYAPVVCGDCEYSNQCQATSAGFTSDSCKAKAACPDPVPGTICTREFRQVVCGDCLYDSQCLATAADPTFTSDTCKPTVSEPIDPEPTAGHGECTSNEGCDSGYCFLGLGSPGTCSCDPEENMGCGEEYVCCGGNEITNAQGLQFFAEPKPECFLPFGSPCSNDPGACLTGVCDIQTKTCACNSMTNYPCDTESGEKCYLSNGSSVCTKDPLGDQGLFKVNEPCTAGEECDTGYCYRTRGAQFCSCNPETAAGCMGEEVCASSEDLIFAQGVADAPPSCFLPDGVKCDPAENKCLSTNCDEATLQCACSTFSNWPCDTENGEVCVVEAGSYFCKLPEISGMLAPLDDEISGDMIAPITSTVEGGQPCNDNEDCISGNCYYGFRSPGRCSCNAETNAGASSADLEVSQRIADASPGCFLPHDAPCNPSEYNCLSGTCDETTRRCVCNTFSNWPCLTDNGEMCVGDENNVYVCQLEKPATLCPEPASGSNCTKEYMKVVCGDCEYDNQCLATAANAEFTPDTCT